MRALHRFVGLIILTPCCIFLFRITSWWVRYLQGEELLKKYEIENYAVNINNTVPRIIHQIYRSDSVPQKWLEAQQSCVNLHKNWTYDLWTDDRVVEFMEENYGWFMPTWRRYPYEIQRVDAARYFLLFHFGGVYLDLDIGCKKDLTPLLGYEAVFPKTTPTGVSNDVMISRPRHPFFEQLIQGLLTHRQSWGSKYLTVFFSTGPIFLTHQLFIFLRKNQSIEARVIPHHLYGSTVESFFQHYPGSSWHGNDVRILSAISKYAGWIVLACIIVAIFIWRQRCKRIQSQVTSAKTQGQRLNV